MSTRAKRAADGYLGLEPRSFALPAVLGLFLSALDAAVIRGGLEGVASLTSRGGAPATTLVSSRAFLGLAAFLVAHATLGILLGLLSTRTAENALTAVRTSLLARLERSAPADADDTDVARLAASLAYDVHQLRPFVDLAVTGFVRHALALLALGSVVIEHGNHAMVPLLVAFALIGLVTLLLARRARKLAEETIEAEGDHASRVLERLRTRDVRFVHRRDSDDSLEPTFGGAVKHLATLRIRLGVVSASSRPAVEAALAVALLVAWLSGVPTETTTGTSLAVLVVAIRPISALFASTHALPMALAARARLRSVATELVPAERGAARVARGAPLEILGVGDGYAEHFLFQRLEARVETGTLVVITGPNGSGKSTLLACIAGVRTPKRGRVALGSIPVRDALGPERSSAVGYLPQSVHLARGSALEATGARSTDELAAALERMGFSEFVASLPAGDDLVGADGAGLSVGQRAKLALARAVLHEPLLLVLDEPTTALDPSSAASLMSALERYARSGHVVIVATHEPRVIDAADARIDLGDSPPALRFTARREVRARSDVA